MRVRAAFIITGLLLVAGCGGSDSKSSDSVKADAGSSSTSASASASASGVFDSKRCAGAVAGMAKVTAAIPEAMSGKSGDLQDSVKAFDKFAEAAPKEIRDDLKTLAAAYAKVAKVLKDIDFDPASGKAPSAEQMQKLASISTTLDTKETQAASDRVSAWFEKNCGKTP